ncbi:MAG TPA: glycosyl hydrolase [Armatimonadota bacterium]|jgi:hypothetical protein
MNHATIRGAALGLALAAAIGCCRPAVCAESPQWNAPDLPLRLPAPPAAPKPNARLAGMLAHARRSNYGAIWRQVADEAVRQRVYSLATDAYAREAAVYRRNGDANGALAEMAKADRYRMPLRAYLRAEATRADRNRLATGARSEPALGCYLGAYIDRDDTLGRGYLDENSQLHKSADSFEAATGRRHASHFMYMAFGRPFPWRWCNALKQLGQIPHIAWEPRSVDAIADVDYLRGFAEDCRRFDFPIFLRLAAEMNGDWTPYHGNPAAYRAGFRTAAAVIHQIAPKAIMLWCPDAQPPAAIPSYYPGDDAVDWVGVNLYSVIYYDNNPARPATDDPVDILRPVYDLYAGRKPIAIGEYAATHLQAADRRSRPDFAAEKIARFYAALPRLFPRVKLMNWYDADNTRHADPRRQLNNYQLTDHRDVLQAYHDATGDPWFLGRAGEEARVVYRPLENGAALSGVAGVSAWTRAPDGGGRVYWAVDGAVKFATARPGAAPWDWDTRGVSNGSHRLSVLLYDSRARFLTARTIYVKVAN